MNDPYFSNGMSKYIKTNSGQDGNKRETRKDNDGFDLTFLK